MDYLTTQQASEIMGVTSERIRALIRNGRLPAQKVGRDWLIDPKALAGFEKRPQGNYKLTDEQIKEIKYMVRDGNTPIELADKYSVSVRTIYRHLDE